jgi:glycerol-3-phosphate dehydrogenase (NAD(P)+)
MENRPINVTIIGTGAYGTVLANVLADNGNNVLMYGVIDSQIDDINDNNLNSFFFGDLLINEHIKATNDIVYALEKAEVVILGTPTAALNDVISNIIKNAKHPMHIINVAKGLDDDKLDLLSKKIEGMFEGSNIAKSIGAIYGPSVAIEVIQRKPTCVMSCNKDLETAKFIAELFTNEYFIALPTTDIAGCEVAAALKNTIAIAAGLLDGMLGSDNSRSCLITIGLSEMYRIASAFGAEKDTFFNFATLGDLILTSTSIKSRNYSLGKEIAKNDGDAKKVLNAHRRTVEGVLTCKVAYEIIRKLDIKCPLFEIMYEILYNNCKPSALMNTLFMNAQVVEKEMR